MQNICEEQETKTRRTRKSKTKTHEWRPWSDQVSSERQHVGAYQHKAVWQEQAPATMTDLTVAPSKEFFPVEEHLQLENAERIAQVQSRRENVVAHIR